jgi:hypothetical protein
MELNIAVFGEAEKGRVNIPHRLNSLESLLISLGHPPEDSQGLNLAIQALLYKCHLIFFRVTREGFSVEEYLKGFRYLEDKNSVTSLQGLALPGVGDKKLLEETKNICKLHRSLIILTEKDLYDYLTSLS